MPTRISLRLSEDDLALIDPAADLCGCSRTDFMREAAVRAAEAMLMEPSAICMSPDGFEAFRAAIAGPARPGPELVATLRRRAPWVDGAGG